MLCDVIGRAREDDKEAMLELIERFSPLLRKYSRKMGYEDAYEDTVLFFIELIKSIRLDRLSCTEDAVVTAYISVSVGHFYDKKMSGLIGSKREIPLSDLTEEQLYYVEVSSARKDPEDFSLTFSFQDLLNCNECRVIHQIFVEGYTTAEIARLTHKSRQAVNQLKKRALKKIRDALKG